MCRTFPSVSHLKSYNIVLAIQRPVRGCKTVEKKRLHNHLFSSEGELLFVIVACWSKFLLI